jgi:hypothetical protein
LPCTARPGGPPGFWLVAYVCFPWQRVRVGINFDGIHILDDAKNSLLLSQPFSKFSFNVYQDEET